MTTTLQLNEKLIGSCFLELCSNFLYFFLSFTLSGGAADCSFWERNLAMQTRVSQIRSSSEKRQIRISAVLYSLFLFVISCFALDL